MSALGTPEEYYESRLRDRQIAHDPAKQRCSCPIVGCEWHGRCKECVTLHRHYKDHVPACMQQLLREKVVALAGMVELAASPTKQPPPEEYLEYVRERDRQAAK